MSDEYYVKPREFTCAKGFLDALDETHELWQGARWLYRGQNVDKSLLPSAMREDSFTRRFGNKRERLNHTDEPVTGYLESDLNAIFSTFQTDKRHGILVRRFTESFHASSSEGSSARKQYEFPHRQFKTNHQIAMERSMFERYWVRAFIILADQVGLKVPRDSFNEIWNKPFPFPDLAEIAVRSGRNLTQQDPEEFTSIGYALARHHRVPTRLLDFTFRSSVAAFFAANSEDYYAEGDANRRIVVWAIRQDALRDTDLKLVKHRRGEIGFLQAQEGAFLLDTLANEKYWFASKWIPFEYYLRDLVEENAAYKFSLPYIQRRRLLELLDMKGINLPSLMPSFDNVWLHLLITGKFMEYAE